MSIKFPVPGASLREKGQDVHNVAWPDDLGAQGVVSHGCAEARRPGFLRASNTPAPGCGEPSWHCMRFRDQALSWPETLRSKKKVPSLGRRGPEARGLASGRILGPGHLGRCLCAVCKLHSYNTPLDHVERNAGATSVLEKRL